MEFVGEVLDYAKQHATDDVRSALEWLVGHGFSIESERGGSGESFGNVHIVLGRGPTRITVDRDRGQWFAQVQPGWSNSGLPLHVLLTARDGTPAEATEFLPIQPPHGASWALELPLLIEWVEASDRRDQVGEADRLWREFMRARLSGPPD
jgi:hypothetical protein